MRRWRISAAALLIFTAGCASRKSTTEPRPMGSTERGSDVISIAELSDPSIAGSDALTAVRRLRPRFLTARGTVSIKNSGAGRVQVSLDGGPLQDVSILGRMRPSEIQEIRFLSAADATQRFGTNSNAGPAMIVTTRRR